jgi:hypothetical protein
MLKQAFEIFVVIDTIALYLGVGFGLIALWSRLYDFGKNCHDDDDDFYIVSFIIVLFWPVMLVGWGIRMFFKGFARLVRIATGLKPKPYGDLYGRH